MTDSSDFAHPSPRPTGPEDPNAGACFHFSRDQLDAIVRFADGHPYTIRIEDCGDTYFEAARLDPDGEVIATKTIWPLDNR